VKDPPVADSSPVIHPPQLLMRRAREPLREFDEGITGLVARSCGWIHRASAPARHYLMSKRWGVMDGEKVSGGAVRALPDSRCSYASEELSA
jgi:hypothetical protein